MKKLLPCLILFLVFLSVSSYYFNREEKRLKISEETKFQTYHRENVLRIQGRFQYRENLISSIVGFFKSSDFVSQDELSGFVKSLTLFSSEEQVCWVSTLVRKKYIVNSELKGLCEKLSFLDRGKIISFDGQKWIMLSQFAGNANFLQKGYIYYFFPVKKIMKLKDNTLYMDQVLVLDDAKNTFETIFERNSFNEKLSIDTNFSNIFSFSGSSFIYKTQRKKSLSNSTERSKVQLISVMITFIGVMLSILVYFLLNRNAQIQAEVDKQTGLLQKSNFDLEKVTQRHNLALEASGVGIWEWNLITNELVWDKQMFALYGVREEDFEGAYFAWEKGLHPEDKERAVQEIQDAIEAGRKFDTEFRVLWPSGEVRNIKALAELISDKDQRPLKMVGVNWDITEMKNYEKQLEESNLRYELMAQGASVGIWDWIDVKGDKEFWSPKFYELLGYENGEIEASLENFSNLLHPDDKNRTFELVDKHFKGESKFDLEYRLKMKSGEYRWFRGTGQLSKGNKGGSQRMVGSIQDIHERILFEEQLKTSNEDLDQFAYIASHDLREPLRGMRNFSQFLIEDYADNLDDEGIKYLETIKKLGARLERYLDSLLYFSRLGREEIAYQKVDLNKLVEEIKETMIETSEGQVEIMINNPLPTFVCDPVKLQKIFGNLFQNSIRYNLNDIKRVEVSYEKGIDGARLFRVKDNGIGMKKDHWQRIFTLFKRLHAKDKFEGGTGVGLTLVKKAVERHGGEIWVEDSIEGEGTTFVFTIKEKNEAT